MSVESLFREEWGRAVSILIRVLGDFELAEDAVQEAFVTAVERWPRDAARSTASDASARSRGRPSSSPAWRSFEPRRTTT